MEGNGIVNQNDIAKIVKAQVEALDSLIQTVVGIVSNNSEIYKRKNVRKSINTILDAIDELNELFDERSSFMNFIKITTIIVDSAKNIQFLAISLEKIYVSFKSIILTLKLIIEVTKSIKNKKTVAREIELLNVVLDTLHKMGNTGITFEMIKVTEQIIDVEYRIIEKLANVAKLVNDIKVLLLIWRVKRIYRFLKILNFIIFWVARRSVKAIIQADLKLKLIQMVVNTLKSLVRSAIILTLVMLIFIVVAPILLLGLWLLLLVVKRIVKMIFKVADKNLITGMMLILLITTILNLIALSMLMLAVVAGQIAPLVPAIFKLIFTLIGIVVLMIVFATLVGVLTTAILVPMIVGFGVLIAIVSLIFVLVVILNILGSLKINRAKILANVRSVIVVAQEIIHMVFAMTAENLPNPEKPNGFFNKILGAFGTLIQYLLASTILVLTVVSVVAILVITIALRLLQTLTIDPVKIRVNIAIVMDIARFIIDSVFQNGKDNKKREKETFWEKFLRWGSNFLGGIADIINAVLTSVFLVLTLVSITMILLIATELRLIQGLKLDPAKVKESVELVMWSARYVIEAIFQKDKIMNQKSEKKFLGRLFEYVANQWISIISSIMSIAYLALMLISICLVVMIADQLKSLQKLDLNPDEVTRKVELVMDTAQLIIDRIFNPAKPNWSSPDTKLRDILKWAFPGISAIVEAITTLATVGMIMMSIGCIKKIAEYLNYIMEIEIDPAVGVKATQILSIADNVVNQVIQSEVLSDKGNTKNAKKSLKQTVGVISSIKEITDTLNSMILIDEKQSSDINYTIDSVIGYIKKVDDFDFETKDKALKNKIENIKSINNTINDLAGIDKSKAETLHNVVRDYSSFINKIDGANLEKLKTATNLFAKMAEFSNSINGNFEDLADSLNTSIAPLLEELRDLIANLPKDIEGSADKIGRTITLTSTEERGLLTKDMARVYEINSNPGLSEAEITKLVDERMRRQSKQRMESVEAKFEELLNIIKGNGTERGIPVIQV